MSSGSPKAARFTPPFAPASSALDYPVCGNGVSEIGETCDDGNAVTESCAYNTSCTVCNASCQSVSGSGPSCGDGTIDANNGEACDDSNAVDDGNGCSATCQRVGACGDGAVHSLLRPVMMALRTHVVRATQIALGLVQVLPAVMVASVLKPKL